MDRGFSSVGEKDTFEKGKVIPPSVELRSPEYTAVWRRRRDGWGKEGERGRLENTAAIYS